MTDGKMFFKKMDLSDLQCNPFDMIGKTWYLLTSGTPEDYNTMTASWGAMGEMWGAPSFHCVVRTNVTANQTSGQKNKPRSTSAQILYLVHHNELL